MAICKAPHRPNWCEAFKKFLNGVGQQYLTGAPVHDAAMCAKIGNLNLNYTRHLPVPEPVASAL
jgi:hypothetical protein